MSELTGDPYGYDAEPPRARRGVLAPALGAVAAAALLYGLGSWGHGLLTRDARKVERKKYGQKGARARFQFSKR